MFKPKRVIPSLAAGALSLSGCANVSGDDGTGGTGGAQSEIESFCMKLVECDPLEYDYDTCVTNVTALDEGLTPQCMAVLRSYFACVDDAPCASFAIDCYNTELYFCLPSTF